VHDECTFFQWADFDSDPFVAELEKMKKKIESLKLRMLSYKRRLYVDLVFGILGWLYGSLFWFHGLSSYRCSGYALDK
ncbi:hypothetical protein PIB30_098917, partial [Stylosanthes scabra]|nr:hypothetical protein [Stylosanthes scabra]